MTKINTIPRLTGYQIQLKKSISVNNLLTKLFESPKLKKPSKDLKVQAFIQLIRDSKHKGKSIDYVFKSLKSFEEDYFGPIPKSKPVKKKVRPKVPRKR